MHQEHSNPPSQTLNPSQQPNPLVPPEDSQVFPGYPAPQHGRPNFSPQGPITNQPIGQDDPNWMQKPPAIPNCPPGLEYLASIDQLLVQQKLELSEMITDFEIENKYSIYNSLGQMVYHAMEDSGTCMRNCCGSARALEMIITDNFEQEVIHLKHPCRGQGFWCFCCFQRMKVYSPPGIIIGTIEETWDQFKQYFAIIDSNGDNILQIMGSRCWLSCCSDTEFEIFSVNSDLPIGKITKKCSEILMETYTNVDCLEISFPKDLDVKMKALLLGALFLIDMMFFEYRKDNTS